MTAMDILFKVIEPFDASLATQIPSRAPITIADLDDLRTLTRNILNTFSDLEQALKSLAESVWEIVNLGFNRKLTDLDFPILAQWLICYSKCRSVRRFQWRFTEGRTAAAV